MTTFTFPAITPNAVLWSSITNTRAYASPTTGATQTAVRKGGRWNFQFSFQNLSSSNAAILRAFLHRLNGQEHRFFTSDPSHQTSLQNTVSGIPLVSGSGQTGTIINVDGFTGTFKAGDRIEFGGELKEITADITSATNLTVNAINIFPEIHTSPANNASVDFTNPVGKFILSEQPAWSARPPYLFDVVINAVEDIV